MFLRFHSSVSSSYTVKLVLGGVRSRNKESARFISLIKEIMDSIHHIV